MTDARALPFLDMFKRYGRGNDTEKEFLAEFFEVACETRDVLKLEINGRGLYECMKLLGRYIY